MGRMIQIRNVPEPIHRALKVRAAQAGVSLSDYLLREVTFLAQRPTVGEFLARIEAQGRVALPDVVAAVRAERQGRR